MLTNYVFFVAEKRQSTESHGFLSDLLFNSICEVVKNQSALLKRIQLSQRDDIIERTDMIAVVKRHILFIRKSYKLLYRKLMEKSNVGLTEFLITGTSGIGKSCFLIYILMQLLCEGFTDLLTTNVSTVSKFGTHTRRV